MNRVQSMFGRHFSTVAGQAVEQATAPINNNNPAAPDVGGDHTASQFTEVCRVINTYPDGAKDAVRAFRKRLSGNKNLAQVSVSVALLEFCVKNLDFGFHSLVGTRDFAGDILIRLLHPKTQPLPVIEKRVLGIIRMLAETYENTRGMTEIGLVYHDLQVKGHKFPKVKPLKVTPHQHQKRPVVGGGGGSQGGSSSRNNFSSQSAAAAAVQIVPPTQSVRLNEGQLAKLRKDVSVVEGNIAVFSEMLTEITPMPASGSAAGGSYDIQLMSELNRTCRAMQQRIVDLIGQVINEEVTVELLRINDDLNNVFLRYERFERYRTKPQQQQTATTTTADMYSKGMIRPQPMPLHQQPQVGVEPPPSYADAEAEQPKVSNDLIDFGFDPTPPAVVSSTNTSVLPPTRLDDDFSRMLSLNNNSTAVVTGGSLNDDLSSHIINNNNDDDEVNNRFYGTASELAEVKEIEKWLTTEDQFGSTQQQQQQQQQHSSSSTLLTAQQQQPQADLLQDEFSAFLNARAATTPSSQQQQPSLL